MKAKQYIIKNGFARGKGIPNSFVAIEAKKAASGKAVYLYGHGTANPYNICCVCGATLNNPVSVAVGIGPICGGHLNIPQTFFKDAADAKAMAKIRGIILDTKVDSWFPISVIKETREINETITLPAGHKMAPGVKVESKNYVIEKKGQLWIYFRYDSSLIPKVKSLPKRRWNPDVPGKPWTCENTVSALSRLKEWGFDISKVKSKTTSGIKKGPAPKSASDGLRSPITTIKNLHGTLYPFQLEGVNFIESRDGNALLGDEMGLGKTVQALAWLALHPEKRPAVIICPASLKLNWKRETQTWLGIDTKLEVLSGNPEKNPAQNQNGIFIINYDIIGKWVEWFRRIKPKVIIADECHFFKNSATKRTKAIQKMARMSNHFLALSGTPAVNRPIEVFNAIKIINPGLFPNKMNFARRYCNAHYNGFGWDFTGASHIEELHRILTDTLMIRRLKADVLKELPPKVRTVVPIELNNRKVYDLAEADFIAWVQSTRGNIAAAKAKQAEALARIEALKQLTIRGKIKSVIQWIENYLDTDGKLVVFATHKETIAELMNHFGNIAVKLDGSSSQTERDMAVHQFQNNPEVRLFVGNLKAAGVGLTLTASSTTCFIELGWTPGDHNQAEDRVHRIGQEADSVNAYYLVADNTIERDILELIDKKRKVLDALLDGVNTIDEESLLSKLLNQYASP